MRRAQYTMQPHKQIATSPHAAPTRPTNVGGAIEHWLKKGKSSHRITTEYVPLLATISEIGVANEKTEPGPHQPLFCVSATGQVTVASTPAASAETTMTGEVQKAQFRSTTRGKNQPKTQKLKLHFVWFIRRAFDRRTKQAADCRLRDCRLHTAL